MSSFMIIESHAQKRIIPLWDGEIPNASNDKVNEYLEAEDIQKIFDVRVPTMEVFLPSIKTTNGQAVLICPGGGYEFLAYDWEGTDIAKWLNTKGIAAFVLKYRLPNTERNKNDHMSPIIDAQRALRLIRYHAEEWNINREKVGVMGFSAGGHLASTLGTQFDRKLVDTSDLINLISARPDFMILIYPVISMSNINAHLGSRLNLLGPQPNDDLINRYSAHLNIRKSTPETFIVHSNDDATVDVENSILMYNALRSKGVPVEMHLFPEGGHGYSMAATNPALNSWTILLENWLNKL